MKYTVTPILHGDYAIEILTTIEVEGFADQISRKIMHIREEATRAALIKLGWTPPDDAGPGTVNDKLARQHAARASLAGRAAEAALKPDGGTELEPVVNEATDAAGGGVGGFHHIDIEYPRREDVPGQPPPVRTIQIGLMDVRAADDIRVSYDFDRDGWRIEQEEIASNQGAYYGTGKWVEVAFVPAWGNESQVEDGGRGNAI